MRSAGVALLILCLAAANAELLSFREQGSDSDTLVLVDDRREVGQDSQYLGLVQQFDLSRPEEGTQQSFTIWPSRSAFVDGGWQTWLEQQLTVLDSLQGILVPRCPHAQAAAAATPPQSDYPSLLSYMASTRFGPSVLTAYARQVDQDVQPGAFSLAFYTDSDEQYAGDEDMVYADDAASVWDGAWAQATQDFDSGVEEDGDEESVEDLAVDPSSWFGQQVDVQSNADIDSALAQPLFRSTARIGQEQPLAYDGDYEQPLEEDPAGWGDACNLALFVALCVGCIVVWAGLIHAWVSCCRLEQQAKAAKKAVRAESFSANPLLTPLIPEGAQTGSNPAFVGVEVASEHPTRGTFFAPQGTEYVSIAYMPLHSEAQARA